MSDKKINPMLDLFFMEAKGQLSVLKESLAALKNDLNNKNEIDSILRASSSIKAASKLASIEPIFSFAQTQENFLISVTQEKSSITSEFISIANSTITLLLQLIDKGSDNTDAWLDKNQDELKKYKQDILNLASNKETVKPHNKTKKKIKKKAKKKTKNETKTKTKTKIKNRPDTSSLSDLSMLELFRMEAETQTKSLNNSLLELENSPSNTDISERLMRAAHSMKGAARMVGLDSAVNVAHIMEDIFVASQNSKLDITHEGMDILLTSTDMLAIMAKATSQDYSAWITENTSKLDELLNALKSILKNDTHTPLSFNFKDKKQTNDSDSDLNTISEDSTTTISNSNTTKDTSDDIVRVSTKSLNRLQALSGEALVETRWLSPFTDSLLQVKKRQTELVSILDRLREKLFDIDTDEYISELMQGAHLKANHCRDLLSQRLTEVDAYDRRSNSLSQRLNREVLQARMRPFSDGIQGLQRLVRDVSRSLNKKIKLDIRGLATQVDRDILEQLQAPLNHMIRNAMDHGIELPAERKKTGKDETGTIRLEAMHTAGMLSIIIQDDGRGINLEMLRNKIIDKGMATADMANNLTESELLDFMFLPNFSTRDTVTEISGRGVGLDVVHSVMQKLRGQIRASTDLGKGLKFQLQLPLTLSVIRALMVEIGGEPYAFPLARIDQTLKINKNHVETMEGRQYFTLGNRHIGLVTSHQILELKDTPDFDDEISIVILGDLINSYGIVVDKFLGERNLVVHALDPLLGKIQDISAASITEDGIPLLIFDVDDLFRSIDIILSGSRLNTIENSSQAIKNIQNKRILIVDDSITVREVERNLLENKGYLVEVAVDGMDGWNAVRTNEYDLIVSDIDMPRMNGFELVRMIKNDERCKKTPVIIVSYKDREEDKQRGLEVGADYYLTKGSFHDDSLVDAVIELIGEPL